MLEEIHCDFKDFSKEVIKGKTYEERKEIFWRCYASNPKKEDLTKLSLTDIVNYIKETDEFYNEDKKYIDACIALIRELEPENSNSTHHVCCICGETFVGYGNNPWPLSKNETDRCCDDCNMKEVIPARLKRL